MVYFLYYYNLSTACPDLRCALSVPPKGQCVLARLHIVWNFDIINDMPMAIVIRPPFFLMWEKGICSPHGSRRISPLCSLKCIKFCPVASLSIFAILHPLNIIYKVELVLLKALLCQLMVCLAESVGVATSMVCTTVPGNFLN